MTAQTVVDASGLTHGWQVAALCGDTDMTDDKDSSWTKTVCSPCTVKGPCLDRAYADKDKLHIAGGLSVLERANAKRRAKRAAR